MFYLKLIVLFLQFSRVFCLEINYCDICSNHVLCKYNRPGKGKSCINYNESSLINQDDINSIVNKVNDRRSFVALGNAQNLALPQAANMKKVRWSDDLAILAQRWVDQCDPHIHPDKTDECRNLVDMNIGQNVATITGLSPGLNVKSFVDIWFMQSLDYKGAVSYYNSSQNNETGYLTQLIWAETYLIGCGKAAFYIGKLLIHRLVCNFGPSGNVDRKPVYLLGFPATQCSEGTHRDATHPALCSVKAYKIKPRTDSTDITSTLSESIRNTSDFLRPPTQNYSSSNSLGMLNLLDNTVKHEIDPIRSDVKVIRLKMNDNSGKRQQKLRHVSNITNDVANLAVSQETNLWDFKNLSRRQEHHFHNYPERGHSHIHHNHDHTTQPTLASNYRRFDNYFKDDFRRFPSHDFTKHQNIIQQCTRKELQLTPLPIPQPPLVQLPLQQLSLPPLPPLPMPPIQTYLQNSDCCIDYTRAEKNCCNDQPAIPFRSPHDHQKECACFTHENTCPTIPNYESNCQCGDHKMSCPSMPPVCPHILRRQNIVEQNSQRMYSQDENALNMALRNGNTRPEYASLKQEMSTTENTTPNTEFTPDSIFRINLHRNRNTKRTQDRYFKLLRSSPRDYDYGYDSMHFINRKKREEMQRSAQPFWQIEGYNPHKPFQLKSLRYTTLPGYKKNYRRTKVITSTEPITILSENDNEYDSNHSTKEKILSFDELMNLRKNQLNKFDSGGRRRGGKKTKDSLRASTTKATAKTTAKESTTNSTSTSKVTQSRIKHCTRKITCTWTMPINPFDNGGGGGGGGGDNGGGGGGGNTRPGYDPQCSRTSTCTRDYLERNRITTTDATSDDDNGSGDDEDGEYCERRSLDIQKRNFETDHIGNPSVNTQDYIVLETNIPYPYLSQRDKTMDIQSTNKERNSKVIEEQDNCFCNMKNTKSKRFAKHSCGVHVQSKTNRNEMKSLIPFSFKNIYFSIVENIFKSNKDHKSTSKFVQTSARNLCKKY